MNWSGGVDIKKVNIFQKNANFLNNKVEKNKILRQGLVLMNKSEENNRRPAFLDRTQLKDSKRVVIKMGSAVITREDGKGLWNNIYSFHYQFQPNFS